MKPMVVPLVVSLVLMAAAPGFADPAADDALIRATYAGNLRAMQAALRAGASFNARDENGYTPLHWAAFRGYGVLVGYMLDRGATVDVPDANGYTPLMLAAANGHDTVVRQLVMRGASKERRSGDGFTAWDYARGQGHTNLLAILQPARTASGSTGGTPTYRPWQNPNPTPAPVDEWPPDEPTVTPSGQPSARPNGRPSPGAPGPSEPANAIEVVGGMHLSRISFPIVGVHYRRSLHDWFSARVGVEYGRTQASRTGALDLGFTRLHAALLTNGWFYVGAGATNTTLGTLYAGGYNPGATSWEAISGLRLGVGPATANAEFRFGVGGPSTTTGGLGLRF